MPQDAKGKFGRMQPGGNLVRLGETQAGMNDLIPC